MQGYTYVKGEHYPVEHLVFETAPEHVQEFLDVDHEVWTLGEAETDLFDHIPFLYKEVWVKRQQARRDAFTLCGRALRAGTR